MPSSSSKKRNRSISNGANTKKSSHSGSSSITKLKVTNHEKQLRNDRKERFGGGVGGNGTLTNSTKKATTHTLETSINMALSSGRQPKNVNDNDIMGTEVVDLTEQLFTINSNKKRRRKQQQRTSSPKHLVGTCTELEKPYLRLTENPKACNVRPAHILQQSLSRIQQIYVSTEDFEYCNEQLKSIRQDLTVQHIIHTKLTVDTYETHARMVLEHGDLNEFNQCVTQLQKITSSSSSIQSNESRIEFYNYAILYAVIQNSTYELHRLSAARIVDIGKQQSNRSEQQEQFAWKVVRAMHDNNIVQFYKLYNHEDAPHMSVYLMDFLIVRIRTTTYNSIVASYRPTIRFVDLQTILHFENDESQCAEFLKQRGVVYTNNTPTTVSTASSKRKQRKKKQRQLQLLQPSQFIIDCKESSSNATT